MKLRRQLALISLIALVLPWALGQYLQVFDRLLREGQIRALSATAEAVAARLGADTALLDNAQLSNRASLDADLEIYAHTLTSPPMVDGDGQDWQVLALTPRLFTSDVNTATDDSLTFKLSTGVYGDSLFILAEVTDHERRFHHSGSTHLASGDHLIIANQQKLRGSRYYAIRAQAPGRIEAVYRDSVGQRQTDYRIRGFWRETGEGYQVELRMPLTMASEGFAVSAISQQSGAKRRAAGTASPWAEVAGGPDVGVLPGTEGRLIQQQPLLGDALSVFARPGMRLWVTDRQGWQVAQAGQLDAVTPSRQPLLQWLLDFAGNRDALPPWQPSHSGRLQQGPAAAALNGTVDYHWYRNGNDDIASVAAPLYLDWPSAGAVESQLAGAVVIEQRLQPWQGLGSSALARLTWISAISGALLIIVLVGYASWLSARIRRLSRAANEAQSLPLPQALKQWPHYRLNDELADLSGQYRTLLTQVHGHTDYLKSLTGKLSHELRTPLAIVRSSLDNMAANVDTPRASDEPLMVYLERARLGSERLSAIITAMSEADRVEASIKASEPEVIDLAELVNDMAAAYHSAYPNHRFTATISPASTGAYQSLATPELLVQLLDKLVDNATDFSPADTTIELQLQVCQDDELGLSYRLSVCNQGPGLPPELEGRLFNSLTSLRSGPSGVNPSGQPSRVHLGLGLYIVELIAHAHHGRARAHNTADGVCFMIEFPARSPGMSAKRPETYR
ncbi:ATP-binding protein [Gilvimarinus agarilyticus]|uniref:ATP-binding protein n=1 Tax=Gilvimarinus agarilyticus TaxID=679259 RepID=UPI0005A273EC|nr:ATP-binding protein [Gilvimarinus agarilyticus]